MYPIQNTDIERYPYGYRSIIYITAKHESLRVVHVATLQPDWFNTMATRRLQGLPILRPYHNFESREGYYQCVFASPRERIGKDALELDLVRGPWSRVIKFIEATRL